MLNKIHLKIKAYVFILLSIIAIGVVVSVGIQNHKIKVRNTEAAIKLLQEKGKQEEKIIIEKKAKTAEEEKIKEEELKKIEDESIARL